MCGIAGFLDNRRNKNPEELEDIALRMGEQIHYRGPDAAAAWSDAAAGVALAHRRLSIIDLSPAGNQPMSSSCNRFVTVYNGEIYNSNELRDDLRRLGRSTFRGHSDTEVMLEGFSAWGVKETLKRLIGMFAIAVWDRKEQNLTLVRDRLGIKPLYWSIQNGQLFFGSELKALYAHPDWKGDLNKDALTSFLRHNYIPSPHSVSKNTQKLEPGHLLTFSSQLSDTPKIEAYWSLEDTILQGQSKCFSGTDEQLIDQLHELLSDAVQRRMISDVPIGAFLSGGIDSSTVTALMQEHSPNPVRTFSIGFEENAFNEAPHAAAVAKHLGTDHTEFYVSPAEARDVIPKLATMFDEPFSDSSQIPTYLVSQMTKEHVTVALSGDGGDELFAGYSRYTKALKLHQAANKVPGFAKRGFNHLLSSLTTEAFMSSTEHLPYANHLKLTLGRAQKLRNLLRDGREDLYRGLVSHWSAPSTLIPGSCEPKASIWDNSSQSLTPNYLDWMRYVDSKTYLPDDILTKVDRASMSVSLEARVPILDHRVVEFAWRLNQDHLIKKKVDKWPLRQILNKYVPEAITDRPKMGFGVPIGSWLRGPLKEWAENLLDPTTIAKHGILSPAPVRQKWLEHLAGDADWQYYLWDILMLQAWCETYKDTNFHDL
ncbi:asparagine synthase (glutamine-hydrolyzing) [Thalassospira lucentensis]|uniref:asparagine synthase (glutamine-hydrolyzing) n=1 Tax=Thalassospira lucentensis TaxID=168935 RepID=UPI00142E40A5|nr:asparagine synthase (glutamine-hydrolyzing) [Thalassospira lucentensis]NIZ00167.1 asparagine synthase (glutamine-hydrolyzing) [Thalassospira lucentensis]